MKTGITYGEAIIPVYLDGVLTGHIAQSGEGYAYYPGRRIGKVRGTTYECIQTVKRSIEGK